MKRLLILLLVFTSSFSFSQSRVAAALDSIPKTKKIDQVQISPDGTKVAYIVEGDVMVASVAGGEARTLPRDKGIEARELTWSPDSKSLAWLADLPGEKPASELWTAESDGGGATKLADFTGYAQTPKFAPDGTRIAVLYIKDMPRIAGPLQPMTPLAGVVGATIYEQRISVVDLKLKELKQVTPADVYVYEYDWAPDGNSWAAIAAHGSGDNNWWIARLYRIDAADGQMHEIYTPKWQIADPHVSSDGKNVAFIEGLMSDEGPTGGDIFAVPLAGGEARNLTPGIKGSPSALAWTGANEISFVGDFDGVAGYSVIHVNRPSDRVQSQSFPKETAKADAFGPMAASFANGGQVMAVIAENASTPPEIWTNLNGQWRQITNLNSGVKSPWGDSKSVHWNNGEARVQGWLMLPAKYDPSKTYPLLVTVHGGPSSACASKWTAGRMGDTTAASLLGWFVLCPNPRGSYGQGEAFTQGNIKDFGGGDFKDIMAGVAAVQQQYPIDAKRIGIFGHSYGGYMTMWAETQTNRFAAAVAGAGLSDFLSYYGLNDIDEWMIPFFGASVYDDPAVYAKSDPIRFVKNVKTPTLILVGDSDGEVPMEQSVEWYHALQTMKVPSQLVVYPGEGHVFFKPADARDYTVRMLRWLDEWFEKAEK